MEDKDRHSYKDEDSDSDPDEDEDLDEDEDSDALEEHQVHEDENNVVSTIMLCLLLSAC